MPIDSVDVFQEKSTSSNIVKKKFSGRGILLQTIDNSLGQYHHVVSTGADRQVALYGLIKACHHWSKIKSAKQGKGLCMKRKIAVSTLASSAMSELKTLSPAFNHFQTQKTVFGKRDTVTGLAQGYHQERSTYVANNKNSNPFSASAVRDKLANMPNLNQAEQQRLASIANIPLEALTDADFQLIANEFRIDPMGTDSVQVVFMNKLKRLDYLVIPRPIPIGGFWDGNPRELIDANAQTPHHNGDTDNNGPLTEMYAMDSYGNLFVKDSRTLGGIGYFNHSSFNAGNPVISAGMILIRNGQLDLIDNNSGHYQPDGIALWEAVKFLDSQNVDVSNARVRVMAGIGAGDYLGSTFCQNGPGTPDWLPAMTQFGNLPA